MIIIEIKGGLGNQMFQYALYKRLKHENKKVKMDFSYFYSANNPRAMQLDIFNLHCINTKPSFIKATACRVRRAICKSLNLYYVEDENAKSDDNVFSISNGIISGYFQNEEYFLPISDEIRKIYTFNLDNSKIEDMIKQIKCSNSVSIHIRRGDYLKYAEKFGNICTTDYYSRAIDYIESHIDFPKFFVFSDDIKWAKQNTAYVNAVFIDTKVLGLEDCYNMYLMSLCKHNIIANSSFSWWGAYLNKNESKIVIAPNKWDNLLPNKDIYCDGWIRM